MHWPVPPEWTGETAFLVGGGPSVRDVDLSQIRGRIIAINNSWELVPHADVLYFCDEKWWRWHGGRVMAGFEGCYIVTPSQDIPDPRGRLVKLTGPTGLYLLPRTLAAELECWSIPDPIGEDAGAYHMAARLIERRLRDLLARLSAPPGLA